MGRDSQVTPPGGYVLVPTETLRRLHGFLELYAKLAPSNPRYTPAQEAAALHGTLEELLGGVSL